MTRIGSILHLFNTMIFLTMQAPLTSENYLVPSEAFFDDRPIGNDFVTNDQAGRCSHLVILFVFGCVGYTVLGREKPCQPWTT
jgi:hypothetical protein